jgi:hypothetical protein
VKVINQSDNFGLYSFITGNRQKGKYRSVGFTKLLMISREDFLKVIYENGYRFKIIKDFPEDNERFNQIKDDILLYHSETVGKVLN